MKTFFPAALLLLGAAGLATVGGCAAVPLTTLARMSAFDARDFAALDPALLRVRVKLPAAYTLKPDESELGVTLTSDAGTLEEPFHLVQERLDPGTVPGGLLGDDVPVNVYTLRLAPASQERFRQVQRFVAHKELRKTALSVHPKLGSGPRNVPSIRTWVEVLLRPDQGYLVLIDGADVPLGH